MSRSDRFEQEEALDGIGGIVGADKILGTDGIVGTVEDETGKRGTVGVEGSTEDLGRSSNTFGTRRREWGWWRVLGVWGDAATQVPGEWGGVVLAEKCTARRANR